MIKLTLGEIITAEAPLAKLNELAQKGELKFKPTYKLARIVKKIQPELEDFREQQRKILDLFAEEEKNENDETSYKITDQENYNKYMNELASFEVELANIVPVVDEELDDVTGFDYRDMFSLGKFVKFENEPDEKEPERKKIKLDLPEKEEKQSKSKSSTSNKKSEK